jgi:8-oxo-dGTP pyrophosphatase MutT (NUDIX family)
MNTIRINANAVIIQDNKVLLIKFNDESGVHYNLPGGGVELGESVTDALKRECMEEANANVNVKDLILCWQYVPELENFKFGSRQKLGLIFRCDLKPGSIPKFPGSPDPNQTSIEWVQLEDLLKPTMPPLFPSLGDKIVRALQENQKIEFIEKDPSIGLKDEDTILSLADYSSAPSGEGKPSGHNAK